MGIYHFAPVGTSPGAVTSALSYMKHNRDKFPVRGDIVESIVLFTSPEIREGREGIAEECVHNDYGNLSWKRSWKRRSSVLSVVVEFIDREIQEVMPHKGTVYCFVLDPNDYNACFERVAKTTLNFAPPGDVGKNIWANLTGGTNVVNAALLQVAFFSGLISRAYYTFISPQYIHCLQPPSKDPAKFRWDDIPILKTVFDEVYYILLRVLGSLSDRWYLDEELLSHLRRMCWEHLSLEHAQTIDKMDIQTFRQQFLNKLDGRELKRQLLPDGKQGRAVRLSEVGRQLLNWMDSPLFKALVERARGGKVENVENITADLDIEELWSKP